MNKEKLCLSSQAVEIAENDAYLELTNRVCFYDEPNLNGALLPYDGVSERAEEIAQTLVNMPVVAKYTVNMSGEPTFKGHEVSVDEDGNVVFGTDTVGTHTEVYIKNDMVETVDGAVRTLPCLFAKYRLWKRNKNVCDAAKRLFELGKLYSSWELVNNQYEYNNGIKRINDYFFLGNALLGYENAYPAYGTSAKAISLSSEVSPGLMIAEAFAQDINVQNKSKKEVEDLKLKDAKKNPEISEEEIQKEKNVSTEEEVNDTEAVDTNTPTDTSEGEVESVKPDEEKAETEEAPQNEEKNSEDAETSEEDKENDSAEMSALTVEDLYRKLTNAVEKKLDTWCYISHLFPNENTIWVRAGGAETELDYVLFTYFINGEDVQISEPQDVKLTVSISAVNDKFDELNENLLKANETIQNLNSEISTLTVFKEKFEKAEQDRIEAEQAEKVNSLKQYAMKSGFITEEEINASEGDIPTMVNELNESGIKAIIAERFMNSLNEEKDKKEIATSEKKKEEVKLNLTPKISYSDEISEFKSIYIKK